VLLSEGRGLAEQRCAVETQVPAQWEGSENTAVKRDSVPTHGKAKAPNSAGWPGPAERSRALGDAVRKQRVSSPPTADFWAIGDRHPLVNRRELAGLGCDVLEPGGTSRSPPPVPAPASLSASSASLAPSSCA